MAGTSPMPVAKLKYSDGEYLLFPGKRVQIGRSVESDLVVNDLKVSRHHAVVEWDGLGFTIRDLGSSNGTFVNGQRIGDVPCKLQDGDQIVLHQQTFRFEMLPLRETGPLSGAVLDENELPGSPKGPRLVVRAGPDAGQEYVLWGDVVTIGRAGRESSWEIRLSDRTISRPHALVQREGDQFTLTDLGSANGTLVNGVKIEGPVTLNHGDSILLGGTELLFYS